MAFCTECGSKLPDDAVFCPNCGASMTASPKNESRASSEIVQEEIKAADYSAPVTEEVKPEPVEPQISGVYVEPTQVNHSAPVQGTYIPPVQGAYIPPTQSNYAPPPPAQTNYAPPPPYQGGYAAQPQPQYNQPNAYGYAPYQGGVNTMPPKKSGGKTAIIVIASVVVVLIIAAILIFKPFGGSPYVGYWESVAVDIGDGVISEDYYGTSIVGAIDMQINSDGSAYLGSAYETEIKEGNWEETDDGILISTETKSHSFDYKNDQLIMENDGEYYYFEKADGDINNPTIPHGSLAGVETTGDDSTTSGNVSGSGYIGDSAFYISVIGSEDFTDIDGDPAIRIYYEFTNYDESTFSMSAMDVVGYTATQDGSQLTETYTADDSSNASNVYYRIRQGLTMQCCAEFKYNPNGGSVDFDIYDSYYGESSGVVTASYVPGSLPGAPAPYVITPILDPQWTISLPSEGTLDSYYVAVTGSEWVTDEYGYQAIRIYYEFTNNSSNNISMNDALWVDSYQDGISLDYTYAAEESQSDADFYTEIAPGQTIQTSCLFLIRNTTSPLEAEVEADTEFAAVGQLFDVAG